MVDTAPEGSDEEVSIQIVMPEPKPAPVAVGGRKEGEDESETVDDTGALDTPPVPPSDEA
jgi:ATP-dependent Clp protease ATP-binding subunit ClpC